MFDSIVLKNASGTGPPIDVGTLAECLLFYRRVVIVGTKPTIDYLLSRIPPFLFLTLLREKRIEFHYLTHIAVVSTQQGSDGRPVYDLGKLEVLDHAAETALPKSFQQAAGNTSEARVGASRLVRLLHSFDYDSFDHRTLLQKLTDTDVAARAVSALLRTVAPEYVQPNPLRFSIINTSIGFHVNSNIDFKRANESYHKRVSKADSNLSEAYILALLQGINEALHFGASLNSEISVSPLERQLHKNLVPHSLCRRMKSEAQIGSFLEFTLGRTFAIREAVNTKKVPFADVLRLLDSADRFRDWLADKAPDSDLVKSYYEAALRGTWAERLPTKTTRWGIFSAVGLGIDALGAGGAGTVAGLAVSGLDSFFVDRWLRGWRPNHFVEEDLLPTFPPARSH